ncbi:hypothetical protein EG68_11865 [Paragonimus skrjabini miyazakii]|uniref:C2H2-type domain-containing protein n=1 Tax=Paragonimus skrjabini miyazakii TaxID=59628 RepID=A0A8S9YDV9_9TREM|nr:hypothetical protein EG68_11865 [Paragonimus skrjabini miyazakii]
MEDHFNDTHWPSNADIAHFSTWQNTLYRPDPLASFYDGSASYGKSLLCPSESCFFDTRTHAYPVHTFSINLPMNNLYKPGYVGIVQHTPLSSDTAHGIAHTNQQALDECSHYATTAYPCTCNPDVIGVRPALIPPVVVPIRTARPQVQMNNVTGAGPRNSGTPTENMAENETSLRRFICDYPGCEKSYGKRSHLTAHYRKHTGERPYVCLYPLPARIGKTLLDRIFGGTVCGQRFSRSDQLTRHRRKHENYKPFECPVCQRSFFRADHRQAHLRTHRIPNVSTKQSTPHLTSTVTNPSITSCSVPHEEKTVSSSYSSSSAHRTALCFPFISSVCSEPWVCSGFPSVPPCSVHLADETQSSYFSL